VLEAMAEGLQAIHRAGTIHNDIKPSNVLVGVDGRITIADFGLARPMSAVCRIDRREIAGTPAYMAPEVARGDGDRPDPAIDIYALGVVAFRLLTGHLPFTHRNPRRVITMQARVAPPRPSRVEPLLPRAFDAVVLGALAKDAARRPASALEFLDRLREADAYSEPEPRPTRLMAKRMFMVG
jgi:serine/threonine-protein kinase